jgi:hypothetical protein
MRDLRKDHACGAPNMRYVIGTLNEGALHARLKEWYYRPGDMLEQRVGGYVVDLVRDDLLVEFQTGGFAPLRRKLAALLEMHRVRLVASVPVSRRIVRLSDNGEILSARRSPKRGCLHDVFDRLVSIPALLGHPGFELEVLLTQEEERRMLRPGGAYRRHGWVVQGRSLVAVEQSLLFAGPADAARLLPDLAATFDTAELAAASHIDRRLAQRMAYCLRALGVITPVGKRGASVLYARRCLTPAPRDLTAAAARTGV